jgi:hypothetical protein
MKLGLPVEWVSIDYGYDEALASPRQLRRDVGGFFRRVRGELGGDAYLWVPEWHPGGHGLHVHFAVGRLARVRSKVDLWESRLGIRGRQDRRVQVL